LRGALRRLDQAAVFQHTRLQPFLDQADDPSIADSVFDESYEPFSAQSIEEPRYVGVENPVDFACVDSVCERIQRIVLPAPGSEPVAEPQELRLVDRREDCDHRCLDDFIFQGSNAERPLFAIRLGYVFANADGLLMPAKKDQPPPDLRYFNQRK
jgi:hypothetical protein